MSHEVEFLKLVYDRFNARDMETVLAAMHDDVMWANGMEGGHVRGRDGVRSYWTRQWAMIDPPVAPVAFCTSPRRESRRRSSPDRAQPSGRRIGGSDGRSHFSD